MNRSVIFGLAIVMVLVLVVFAIIKIRKQKEIRKKYPGYPKGYWLNQGMGIGIAIGVGMGAAFNNVAIGTAIGVAIGTAIGSELEKKHKDEIRPMTAEEKKLRTQALILSGTFIAGLAIFLVAYFLLN